MPFTFKTTKPTGKYKSFFHSNHEIKIRKMKVGRIEDETWKISLMVVKSDINEDGNQNCDWKWVTLKHKPSSLEDAKKFLNLYFDLINEKYNLKQVD